MNFQLTKKFIEKIESWIQNNDSKSIKKSCERLLAPDIAEILKTLNFNQAKYLLNIFYEEKGADILIELEEDLREKLLSELSSKEIIEDVIENLDSDDAADAHSNTGSPLML